MVCSSYSHKFCISLIGLQSFSFCNIFRFVQLSFIDFFCMCFITMSFAKAGFWPIFYHLSSDSKFSYNCLNITIDSPFLISTLCYSPRCINCCHGFFRCNLFNFVEFLGFLFIINLCITLYSAKN